MIEEALYTYITAQLSARIGTRCYPLRLPENVTYDAVTYQRISSNRVQSHEGSSHYVFARFQFSIFSKTYTGAKTTLAALVTALEGYSGGTIDSSLSQDERDFYDPTTRIYRTQIDFLIGFQE